MRKKKQILHRLYSTRPLIFIVAWCQFFLMRKYTESFLIRISGKYLMLIANLAHQLRKLKSPSVQNALTSEEVDSVCKRLLSAPFHSIEIYIIPL